MNLKELRISKGFSQKNAALFLKMPLRTYKRYELEKKYENSYKYKAIFEQLKLYEKIHKKNADNCFNKILIVGGGHVGFNFGKVLSKKYKIQIVDIDIGKVKKINELKNPNLNAISKISYAGNFQVAVICLPTNFNETTKTFDTIYIEKYIKDISNINPSALIVIKSTVQIGFTDSINVKNELIYSPEFLKEKTAYEDSEYPDRIVVGCKEITNKVHRYALTVENVINVPRKTIFMSNKEAEAVKLFSNAYLAMRLSFFNSLDSFALNENINTKKVIKAMGLDPRIGDYYNNPSYFYSGYCLPKDTRALSQQTRSKLLDAVVNANEERKQHVVKKIIEEANKISPNPTIGIYNLEIDEQVSKNHVSSSFEILQILRKYSRKVVVFDKNYSKSIKDFDEFCNMCDLIICNKYDKKLDCVKSKVFTRDILSK